MYEVTMPKLSDSMEEGKIIEWKVKEGDQVEEGDVLAEVESDKAVMELECFRSGTIQQIKFGDDSEVPVGEVIALIVEEGAEAPSAEEASEAEDQAPAEAEEKVEEHEDEPSEEEMEEAEGEDREEPAPTETPTAERTVPAAGGEDDITPYARKLAEDKGLNVAEIDGSGPGGRIVAEDVQKAAGEESRVIAVQAEAEATPPAAEPEETRGARARGEHPEEELPPLEVGDDEAEIEEAPFRLKTQARRVIASQHVIPHFYITRGVDVTPLMKMKEKLKEGHGATITHVVMLGVLKAIGKHPGVNRSYDHGRVINWKHVNLGLAVDTEQGLTVAVLKEAESLSFDDLIERTQELVDKARNGKLGSEERRHPTFTVTNLGPMDVEHFEPIINPPSSITLAVSSALPTAVVKEGAVILGQVMKLTAACDHRIIDGATAARFLKDLRLLLEDPRGLLNGT